MSIKVLVPLAGGFEEIEAITIVDVLRRAGIAVDVVSLDSLHVKGAHQIVVHADLFINQINGVVYDAIVLPGGMPGSDILRKDPRIVGLVKKLDEEGKIVAAICAGPLVLFEAGVLEDDSFTIHPSVMNQLPLSCRNESVCVNGNIITGQAAGSALKFALTVVDRLLGHEKVTELNQSILTEL